MSMHITDEAWAHMSHEGHPRARLVRLVPETRAETASLVQQSVRNPELREQVQLILMRRATEWGMPGLGTIAARDRYHETTHGGDWPEDH